MEEPHSSSSIPEEGLFLSGFIYLNLLNRYMVAKQTVLYTYCFHFSVISSCTLYFLSKYGLSSFICLSVLRSPMGWAVSSVFRQPAFPIEYLYTVLDEIYCNTALLTVVAASLPVHPVWQTEKERDMRNIRVSPSRNEQLSHCLGSFIGVLRI